MTLQKYMYIKNKVIDCLRRNRHVLRVRGWLKPSSCFSWQNACSALACAKCSDKSGPGCPTGSRLGIILLEVSGALALAIRRVAVFLQSAPRCEIQRIYTAYLLILKLYLGEGLALHYSPVLHTTNGANLSSNSVSWEANVGERGLRREKEAHRALWGHVRGTQKVKQCSNS